MRPEYPPPTRRPGWPQCAFQVQVPCVRRPLENSVGSYQKNVVFCLEQRCLHVLRRGAGRSARSTSRQECEPGYWAHAIMVDKVPGRAFSRRDSTQQAARCGQCAKMLRDLLDNLSNKVNTNLRLHPAVARLTDAKQSVALRDNASLRRHVVFTFTVKCSFWAQLPWVLAGVGP